MPMMVQRASWKIGALLGCLVCLSLNVPVAAQQTVPKAASAVQPAAAPVSATPPATPTATEAPALPALPPNVTGPSLLMDARDGRLLYAEDIDNQWFPASLTKIMTAYVTFEAIKEGKLTMETRIAASEHAHSMPPSKVGLPVGATMPVDLALRAVIIKSANDVSVMLAEAISGSEPAFVERMNATAKRLGMTRTVFQNANGLPHPEQVTTARDLAKLARAVLRDFPEHIAYWSMPDVRIGRRKLRTHNGLLRTYDGADGLKTGFICDSGYNVVATASRDGRKLVAIVLGQHSGAERNIRTAALLQHGFDTGQWYRAVSRDTIDSAALVADAKSAFSIRRNVLTRECGNRRRRAAPVAKRPKTKAQQVSAAKAAPKKHAAAKSAAAPKKTAN
jgi:D-alanyl-D-alanine carboxypeptidase